MLSGVAGTAAMTLGVAVEKKLRWRMGGPVDYDASNHVVQAAATVLRHQPSSAAGNRALFLLMHWGYGSAVAIGYPPLRRRFRRPARDHAVRNRLRGDGHDDVPGTGRNPAAVALAS